MKHIGGNVYVIKDRHNRPVLVGGRKPYGVDNFDGEIKDFDDKERSFLAVASRESVDRLGDIIEIAGWQLENYRKNPVVMPFHNYQMLPVGRSLEEFTRKKDLMFRPQFAPYEMSTTMYSMYRDKYLKGFSVGFIPIEEEAIKSEDEDDKKAMFSNPTRYKKQELLEISVAPVPAHPDALAEIKTMVRKNQLWIPAKYLLEKEDELGMEDYDEYIHIIESCKGKFDALYVVEIEEGILVVYGPRKEEEDKTLYFNQRFIFYREIFNAEGAMKWVKENDTKVDIFEDDGSIILSVPGIEAWKIELVPYEPDKYEVGQPILVDALPVCDPSVFGECIEVEVEIEGEEIALEIEGEDIPLEQVERPFPNEHSCRLNPPGKYKRFRRNNCYRKSDNKCIDFIFGVKKSDNKSEIQAMRYPKDIWTASAARSHCKGKGGTFEAAGESSIDERISEVELTLEGVAETLDCLSTSVKDIEETLKTLTKDDKGSELELELEVEEETQPELELEIEDETLSLELDLDVSDEEATEVIRKAVRASLGKLD